MYICIYYHYRLGKFNITALLNNTHQPKWLAFQLMQNVCIYIETHVVHEDQGTSSLPSEWIREEATSPRLFDEATPQCTE